jgi:peptidoglycan/xylan/chitin deacetylase (PgdA/CDA1 family)
LSADASRPFLVCIHDATPAYARETREMIHGLAALLGRRLACGVVPDWHGEWPLAAHRDYCRFVQESCDELLLHGYFHLRRHGWGPATFLAEACDEMSGLDAVETRQALERGQDVFSDVFGEPAGGFLAPAWQVGHVRLDDGNAPGLNHVLGFFSLVSGGTRRIPLATFAWDCGRWGWLGHVGDGIGRMLELLDRGVPTLAIHPRDLERGYWPRILQLTEKLLEAGYEPSTPARLLETSHVEVDA